MVFKNSYYSYFTIYSISRRNLWFENYSYLTVFLEKVFYGQRTETGYQQNSLSFFSSPSFQILLKHFSVLLSDRLRAEMKRKKAMASDICVWTFDGNMKCYMDKAIYPFSIFFPLFLGIRYHFLNCREIFKKKMYFRNEMKIPEMCWQWLLTVIVLDLFHNQDQIKHFWKPVHIHHSYIRITLFASFM